MEGEGGRRKVGKRHGRLARFGIGKRSTVLGFLLGKGSEGVCGYIYIYIRMSWY